MAPSVKNKSWLSRLSTFGDSLRLSVTVTEIEIPSHRAVQIARALLRGPLLRVDRLQFTREGIGEGRGDQHRLLQFFCHTFDKCRLIGCRADDGKFSPLMDADVSINDITQMQLIPYFSGGRSPCSMSTASMRSKIISVALMARR